MLCLVFDVDQLGLMTPNPSSKVCMDCVRGPKEATELDVRTLEDIVES